MKLSAKLSMDLSLLRKVLECASPLALSGLPERQRTAALQDARAPAPVPFLSLHRRAIFKSWKLPGIAVALLLGILLPAGLIQAAEPAAARPNIVILLADDMGFSDIG